MFEVIALYGGHPMRKWENLAILSDAKKVINRLVTAHRRASKYDLIEVYDLSNGSTEETKIKIITINLNA